MRAVATATRMPPAQMGAADAFALKKLAKQAGEAAQLLKLLGNEKRLLILCFLAARGEMTVGELVDVVKLSQSALSQHLGRLRAEGLVAFRRTSWRSQRIAWRRSTAHTSGSSASGLGGES